MTAFSELTSHRQAGHVRAAHAPAAVTEDRILAAMRTALETLRSERDAAQAEVTRLRRQLASVALRLATYDDDAERALIEHLAIYEDELVVEVSGRRLLLSSLRERAADVFARVYQSILRLEIWPERACACCREADCTGCGGSRPAECVLPRAVDEAVASEVTSS